MNYDDFTMSLVRKFNSEVLIDLDYTDVNS